MRLFALWDFINLPKTTPKFQKTKEGFRREEVQQMPHLYLRAEKTLD